MENNRLDTMDTSAYHDFDICFEAPLHKFICSKVEEIRYWTAVMYG